MNRLLLSFRRLFMILSLGLVFTASNAFSLQAAAEAMLTISTKGHELAYDKTKLSAKPGQKVKLTFKNTSGMQHNWVLVKPGTADKVANASIVAGASKNWLASDSADVLAYTKLVNGGQSDTVVFTAPTEPGEYPFVCTFPGHAALMRGVLVVK